MHNFESINNFIMNALIYIMCILIFFVFISSLVDSYEKIETKNLSGYIFQLFY